MNIVLLGPPGAGKGTQALRIAKNHSIPHISTGDIFRRAVADETELGVRAKGFMNRGELVPDEITIPMILDRLKRDDCKNGWLLDGFPRSKVQAEKLDEALKASGLGLDFVIEVLLDREIAKNRIMGRRLCANDNNHPNNIFIDAIKPDGDKCRVCGGDLSSRSDDQDEEAIGKRHKIYYDTDTGTLAAAYYFKDLAGKAEKIKYVTLDGAPSVQDVTAELMSKLQ